MKKVLIIVTALIVAALIATFVLQSVMPQKGFSFVAVSRNND